MRLCLVLALAACSCKKPTPLWERIYGLDEIPTFEITLDEPAMAALAKKPRDWVHGGFAYKDDRFADVGVRLKGHRSMRKLGAKSSFKIKLDRFTDQKLDQQKTITLNNMVEDPAMMREVLAYRLYRALGVAAPSAGFAEVVLNGKPQGLYAVIESIDKKFLTARFADPEGPIYEGEWGCDVIPEDVEGFDNDGGTRDRSALAELAKVAAGDADTLFGPSSPLDVPAFLRFLAVEMYVGNFDGYRHGHNYRLYFEPTKRRWYFVPWGLDRTFVKAMSIYDSQGYLAKRCFADARCRLAYARTMREVVAEARRLELQNGVDVIGVVTGEHARGSDVKKKRAALRTYLVDRPAEVERELTCLDAAGNELDADHDGFGCRDCNDRDPAIHPGAAERCDGVDTNCNGLVDDAPACGCSPLAAGDAKLSICDLPMPQADAQKFCAARGETLAWIDSEAQQELVVDALRTVHKDHTNDRWWIGLSDRAREGSFTWLAGTSAYTHWDPGEPNNAGCNQDCVVIDLEEAGRWSDTHCLEHRPFVCRTPVTASGE